MSLQLTAAPAVEPVSLVDAKAQLRVDPADEDAFISSLIITSRLHIEAALGLALIQQGFAWTFDAWPQAGGVVLPVRPVSSITSLKLTNTDGSQRTLESWRYVLDGTGAVARLLPTATRFPDPGTMAQGIEIRFTAGFGANPSDVPPAIRQALLMLVAHWFENREPVATGVHGTIAVRIPDTVNELLAPYRTTRI